MRKATSLGAVAALMVGGAVVLPTVAHAEVLPTATFHSEGNPIVDNAPEIEGVGQLFTADPAPLVADGKLYIHTGRDQATANSANFNMQTYQVLATEDVDGGDWEIYKDNLDPDQVFTWATGNMAFAGQVVEGRDGKFYWYVPVQWTNTAPANRMAIGVAVSDTPVGPWTDHLGAPLVTWTDIFGSSTNGQEVIDPHVFIDDDDKVYLYWGSWNVARVWELESDMKTKVGTFSTMSGLTSFFEAPWVIKRNGIYHMVYDWKQGGSACTPSNYQACIGWATASNPKGPWTYQGIILDAQSATTMHPSIIEYDGKWYITYHTKDSNGGGHFRRSVAIDEFTWTGDTINKVTPTWSQAFDKRFRVQSNVAPEGQIAVSFTETPPMRSAALNDGRQLTALLPPDQWGNYRGTTSSNQSDWVSYKWDTPVRINGAGIQFHQDSNWIRPPASWVIEYLNASGEWVPVPNPSAYPVTTAWNTLTFDPVTTTALRATFNGRPNGAYYHSVSVSEWEVYSVAQTAVAPVEVLTQSGVAPAMPQAVRVTWDGSNTGWAPVNWLPIDPAQYAEEGSFTVQGRALGRSQDLITATVTVDDDGTVTPPEDETPPVSTIGFTGTSGADGWFRSAVTARVSGDDETSFLNTVSIKVGDGAWVDTPNARFAEAQVTTDGTTTVYGKTTDAAGNVSPEVSGTVKIDRVLPTASAEVSPTTRETTITASDALSGLASVTYQFDGAGEWLTYSGPVAAPSGLPHTLAYRATDVAGNVRTGSVSIPMETGATLSGNVAKLGTPTTSFVTGWNTNAGLTDGEAGPLEVFTSGQAQARLGVLQAGAWGTWPQVGEQWARISWDFDVTVDTAAIYWLADSADGDNAGVIPPASWKLQYLAADGTTWVDITPATGSYSRTRNAWNTVTFAPVTTRAMRMLGQSWGAESAGGSMGIHEFQIIAVEGNQPPTVEIATAPEASAAGWNTSDVTVTVTAEDDSDADPAIEIKVGDGDWVAYTAPVVISTEGSTTVQARATDSEDEVSEVASVTVQLDKTPPAVSGSAEERVVTVTATDEGSGIDVVEYRIGAGEWTEYTGPVTVPGFDAATVQARATDVAGNVSEVESVEVAEVEQHFTDVPPSNPFFDAINWAAQQGITTGYPDGTFRPSQAINRDAVAAMLFRYENPGQTAEPCTVKPFTDVEITNQFCGEIAWMKAEGITTGNADGSFSPADPVSRQAIAAFLARAWGPESLPACTSAPFADVSAGAPFCKEIAWVKAEGISTGWVDGSISLFKPSASIERQAFVTFLYRDAHGE